MIQKIEISHKTIIFTAAFILLLWLIFQIKDILLLLFVSFIGMSALRPSVDFFQKLKIPRPFSIVIVYLIFLSIISIIVTLLFPPLINQSLLFITSLPRIVETFLPFIQINQDFFIRQITPLTQNLFRLTIGFFSNIFILFSILVFTFYFLLEREKLEENLKVFIGEAWSKRVADVLHTIEQRLGNWVRGQLILGLVVGIFTYFGLFTVNLMFPYKIDYILPLSIIAGILEIMPIIGPIISAIPAIFVALAVSPVMGFAVAIVFIIVQQAENNLIVPIVMRKAVGLPPLVVILALMIGGRLAGVLGALLSIPLVVVAQIVFAEALKNRQPFTHL